MPCVACGCDAPADFAFCPKCGKWLADQVPVTVMFADLTGFTALAESIDPEDLRALQAELRLDVAAIKRCDDFVEKCVDALQGPTCVRQRLDRPACTRYHTSHIINMGDPYENHRRTP